jgi:hypothetical protein
VTLGQYYNADATANGTAFAIATADPTTLNPNNISAADANGDIASAWTTLSGAVMLRLLTAP